MRRLTFAILGLLELLAAAALVAMAIALPGRADLRRSLDGARDATAAAGDQLRIARDEVAALRDGGVVDTADRLAAANRSLAVLTARGRLDFEALAALRDGLGRTADGLDALAGGVDPEAIGRLGVDLEAAAGAIDGRIVPAALDAAERLEAASGPLGEGAARLAEALAASPIDLGALGEVRDGLDRLDEGLEAGEAMVDPGRLAAIGEAADGAEGVVAEAARLAERASGYTYPVVELDGLAPRVRQRPFWPRGDRVGRDLRRVAAGMEATERQVAVLSRELPRIEASIAQGRRGLAATGEALDRALERRAEVERLLRDLPAHANRMAEELPRLAEELSGALREAGRLGELADSLRAAGSGITEAAGRWPGVRSGLDGAADVLRSTRDSVDLAIRHRDAYESAFERVADLSARLAETLPADAGRLDARLAEEEAALAAMGAGLDRVDDSLPTLAGALDRCLLVGRLLAMIVATIAALHGVVLLVDAVRSRQDSGGRPGPALRQIWIRTSSRSGQAAPRSPTSGRGGTSRGRRRGGSRSSRGRA